jgi:hypothetical protein
MGAVFTDQEPYALDADTTAIVLIVEADEFTPRQLNASTNRGTDLARRGNPERRTTKRQG